MTINRKQLVLDALDGKGVERIPSGFWFHFLDDEIGSDAFAHPELSQKVLAKQIEYIDSFRPDYVKIMTDGFFHYNHPQVAAAQRVEDLKNLQPLAEDDPWFTRQIEYIVMWLHLNFFSAVYLIRDIPHILILIEDLDVVHMIASVDLGLCIEHLIRIPDV